MIHPEHYSAGESARRAVLLIRGGNRARKGKSTARFDKALDRLAAEAVEREAQARKK